MKSAHLYESEYKTCLFFCLGVENAVYCCYCRVYVPKREEHKNKVILKKKMKTELLDIQAQLHLLSFRKTQKEAFESSYEIGCKMIIFHFTHKGSIVKHAATVIFINYYKF